MGEKGQGFSPAENLAARAFYNSHFKPKPLP
jgi:hypothetical protein